MMLTWIGYASLVAALLGAAAAGLEMIAEHGARARRWPWVVALVASVVVPFAIPVLRSLLTPAIVGQTSATATVVATTAPASSLDGLVLMMWPFASIALVVLFAIAHHRNRRTLRACRPMTLGGHRTLLSDDFGPALVGMFPPKVVVPSWILTLSEDEQQLVVDHELEHARAHDPILALLGVTVAVLLPWNPAVWWQLTRLRLAIELDCDARVVSRGRERLIAYGQLLLHVGERDHATRHPVLALSHSRSSLGARMDALFRRRGSGARTIARGGMIAIATLGSVAFLPAPRVDGAAARMSPKSGRAHVSPSREPATIAQASPEVTVRPTSERAGPPARRPTRRPQPVDARASALELTQVPPVQVTHSSDLAQLTIEPARLPPNHGGAVVRASAGGFVAGGFARATAAPSRSGAAASTAGSGGAGAVLRSGSQPRVAAPRDTTKPPTP